MPAALLGRMSTELEQARLIAARIARRVSGTSGSQSTAPIAAQSRSDVSSELAAMRAGLSELQKRLTQIEAKVRPETSGTANAARSFAESEPYRTERPIPLTHSPWLAGVNATAAHPSQERFGVEEAVVSELVDFFGKEQTCGIEPGGKPCDHCEMCSSRGF
jgi:hypothetical protein